MADLQLQSTRATITWGAVRYRFWQWRTPAAALSIALLTGLSFVGGLHNKPVAEDFIPPREFATLGANHQFRPLFALVMQVLLVVAGPPADRPVAYHLASIGIHIGVVVVLFALIRLLTGSLGLAASTALVFAIYPRHHETILWPAASLHALMTLWILASFYAYQQADRTHRRRWQLLSVVFFAFGMLSSEDGAAAIGLVLAYDILWHTDTYRAALHQVLKHLVSLLVPYIAVLTAYVGLLVVGSEGILHFVGARSDTSFYHLSLGFGTAKDFAGYLTYTIFPFVPLREVQSSTAKALLMVAALMLLIGAYAHGTRLVRFGIIWISITILPYVLLVPFGNADRYFYLPAIGFCLLVVGLGQQWLARIEYAKRLGSKYLVRMVLVCCMILYCLAAISVLQTRSRDWSTAGNLVDDILS
ncbi:MAG: hypothetical protein ACTHMR_07290, partial [Thermomicrobiales bacterium]